MVINKFSIVVSSILAVPQFRRDSEPVNFNGTNDDEVIIRCDADAIPSSSTQWYMNGDPLNGKNLGNGANEVNYRWSQIKTSYLHIMDFYYIFLPLQLHIEFQNV